MGHVSLPDSFSGCWQDFVSHCLMAKTPVCYCMDLSSITYFLIKGSMQGQERTRGPIKSSDQRENMVSSNPISEITCVIFTLFCF